MNCPCGSIPTDRVKYCSLECASEGAKKDRKMSSQTKYIVQYLSEILNWTDKQIAEHLNCTIPNVTYHKYD